MVTWFAGLFYIGRLFVYYAEANTRPKLEKEILKPQYALMMRRLWYGITWPGMILTIGFGIWAAIETHAFSQGWFHLKMLFVVALILYHHWCGAVRKKLIRNELNWSSLRFRFFNEVPTLLLFLIVFTVYLKDLFSGLLGGLISLGLISAISLGILGYRRIRNPRS